MAGPNIIDRLVGFLNPRAGLLRSVAREQLKRAYEGASRRDGWHPRRAGASANTDHAGDAADLRVRARALVQNVPYITAGIAALVAATVGTGIAPRSLASKGDAARIDALWDQWAKVADADGLGNLYSLQARAYRAMEIDGEVLIRLRPRALTDGLPVPLQLQLLEIDWLDSAKNGTLAGRNIVNGIEYDALGRVAAYWIFDQHPGELVGTLRKGASRAVPANRIIHLYAPERPGQGRGFSRLAPVVARVRDLQLYEDAELSRKNLETRLSVLASGDLSQLEGPPEEVKSGSDLGQLASGGITSIPAGMTVTVVEPKAAPGYTDYIVQQLHVIAAGLRVPYESMTGDMEKVNFSSARIRRIDFKRDVEQVQWLLLVPQLCEPIRAAFLEYAQLAGKLQRGEPGADWSTPKWEYLNPVQDVKGDADEIAAGLSSFSEKLRQRGYKPDLVFSELKTDLERLQADGVLPLLLAMKSGNAAAAMPVEDQPKAAAAARQANEISHAAEIAASTRAAEHTHRSIADLTAMVTNLQARQSAPPVINNITLPEQRNDIHNHIAAPAPANVEVRNTVNVPETVVNVEAVMPEVRAADPVPVTVINQVQPAPVTVNNTHPSRAVQTVERDANDEITRTVTTYEE